MGRLVRGWHGNTGQPASASATATSSMGRPASPSRAAARSPSTKRGASDETTAGAAGARAVMGSPLLARLRRARVEPLLNGGGVEAELPPSDFDERYLPVLNEVVDPRRSHVQQVGNLVNGPHGMGSSRDRTARSNNRGGVALAVQELRVPRGVLGIGLSRSPLGAAAIAAAARGSRT